MTSYSSYGSAAPGWGGARWHGSCSARSWRPFEVAALVVSFAFWWPLGLAVLAFKLAKRRGVRFDQMAARARAAFSDMNTMRSPGGWQPFASAATGNTAFDDWRSAEMARLDEERRKLDAAQQEFAEHLHNLRRARDKEEFDGFMAARQNRPSAA